MICLAHLNFEAMKVPFLFALVSITTAMMAQPNLTPGAPQSERILVLGGTAHLGTGEAIENAAIGFEDGIIDFVGAARDVDPKRYARVVSAEGMHIYPGFIAPQQYVGPHGGGRGARFTRLSRGGDIQAQCSQLDCVQYSI